MMLQWPWAGTGNGKWILPILLLLLSVFAPGAPQANALNDDTPGLSRPISENEALIRQLIQDGESLRIQGDYPAAGKSFSQAVDRSRTLGLIPLELLAAQSLGYLYYLQNNFTDAATLLEKTMARARASDLPGIAAICANRLGIVYTRLDQTPKARQCYEQALALNQSTGDPGLEAAVQRNLARIETDPAQAFLRLDAAKKAAEAVVSPAEQANLLIGIAAEAALKDPEISRPGFRYDVLSNALNKAIEARAHRSASQAAGKLGALYRDQGRLEGAFACLERAVAEALVIGADDLLFKWAWMQGQILREKGERQKAIAAYWRAAFHVREIQATSKEGCVSLLAELSPLYLELADMLFLQAQAEQDETARQELLRNAQTAVESMKQSELRDYFKDACIDALSQEVESLSEKTAVIYPVLFPDRLVVLADIGGSLYPRTIPVSKKTVEKRVTQLAYALRNGLFYEQLSHQVYDWLIAPVDSLLAEHEVNTLVFVPDGKLRTIPLAALKDKEGFLIEKYAVATEPGLSLLDPKPLPRDRMQTLLAGMSEPGPVVAELPAQLKAVLSKIDVKTAASRGIRGLSVKTDALNDNNTRGGKDSVKELDHIKAVLALPGVNDEIEVLAKSLPGQTMLNKDFLLDHFASTIKESDYSIVHIASHGFFGGSPEQNFIMAYDKLLNMNHLKNSIKPRQLVQHPVELITLSACQTAEGDDRSPLGLAGVALKSGARSVMGSLWPVSDLATRKLIASFYGHLKKNSKAWSLQQAQIEMIRQEQFSHPFYWSPFILVGNWL